MVKYSSEHIADLRNRGYNELANRIELEMKDLANKPFFVRFIGPDNRDLVRGCMYEVMETKEVHNAILFVLKHYPEKEFYSSGFDFDIMELKSKFFK